MGTGYKEGNDAYKSGGGGAGGLTAISAGAGIDVNNSIPNQPQISALVRGMYNIRARLEALDNNLVLAQIGNVLDIPDNSEASPGPGWDTAYFEGSNPISGLHLEGLRVDLQTLYSITSGIPFLVINKGTATLNVYDSGATFNGVAGPYVLVPGASLLMVTDTTGTNWLCQQIGPIGGQVNSVVAGAGVDVDSTDPANPVVSSSGTGLGAVAGIISMPLAACRNAVAVPGVNNAGALLATLTALSADITISKLGIWIKQTGSGLVTLGIYNSAGTLLAKTGSFAPSAIGYHEAAITTNGAGGAITEIDLTGNNNYYLAVHGNQASNGSQFYGQDVGTTFGPSPYIGWGKDNIATMPNSISGGSENAQRFMMVGRA